MIAENRSPSPQIENADHKIPWRLNLLLSAAVSLAALGLLWFASHVESWFAAGAAAVVFSFVMLTNYALLHEAEHGMLFSRSFWNDAAGRRHALLFPSSFTLMRTTHLGHHRRNRTDTEMFDLYYQSDRRWLKFVQWYGILLGMFWPTAPVGAVVMSLRPPERFEPLFTWARTTGRWIADFQRRQVTAIRLETLAGIGVWIALWHLLDLDPWRVLLCYACAGFNWSTRQYVEHAFTRRNVLDGALNLKCARWHGRLLLNQEWHLNHHRRPNVPWTYLPELSVPEEPRHPYWRAYLSLWRGPRLTDEPPPAALEPRAAAAFKSADSSAT